MRSGPVYSVRAWVGARVRVRVRVRAGFEVRPNPNPNPDAYVRSAAASAVECHPQSARIADRSVLRRTVSEDIVQLFMGRRERCT